METHQMQPPKIWSEKVFRIDEGKDISFRRWLGCQKSDGVDVMHTLAGKHSFPVVSYKYFLLMGPIQTIWAVLYP